MCNNDSFDDRKFLANSNNSEQNILYKISDPHKTSIKFPEKSKDYDTSIVKGNNKETLNPIMMPRGFYY